MVSKGAGARKRNRECRAAAGHGGLSDWLRRDVQGVLLPGGTHLCGAYERLTSELPGLCAAAKLDAAHLTCALLDLELGDGLGTDVAELLRKGQTALPIAFFTSTRTPEVLARAAKFGPVFEKPDQLDQAIDWVRRNGRS